MLLVEVAMSTESLCVILFRAWCQIHPLPSAARSVAVVNSSCCRREREKSRGMPDKHDAAWRRFAERGVAGGYACILHTTLRVVVAGTPTQSTAPKETECNCIQHNLLGCPSEPSRWHSAHSVLSRGVAGRRVAWCRLESRLKVPKA